MGIKLTYEFVRSEFEKRGYTLLSTEYHKNTDRLQTICPDGHKWETSWMNFRMGSNCPECVGLKKKTYEEVNAEFTEYGCQVLTPESEYINSIQKLNIICACGRRIKKSYHDFTQDRKCKRCDSESYEVVKSYYEEHGFALLEGEYHTSRIKLWCLCPKGHAVQISYGRFKEGVRCRFCQYEQMTIHDIRNGLFEHGFVIISSIVDSSHLSSQLFDVVCPNGHVYNTSWNCFQQGHRCWECHLKNCRGENSWNWNHDITDEERLLRRLYPEYKEWRNSVFERDKFTCQVCYTKGGKLQAHHLYSYAQYKHERLKVENGATLCKACHSTHSENGFHRIYGTRNFTPQDFYEYKQWRQEQLGIKTGGESTSQIQSGNAQLVYSVSGV